MSATSQNIRKRSITDLVADFDKQCENQVFPTEKLSFKGVGDNDVYNSTAPFQSAVRTVIAGRVEARNSEASRIVFFEKKRDDWHPIEGAPIFNLQDPFVADIRGELVLGGVELHLTPEGPERGVYKTVFYRGKDIFDLTEFAEGPTKMKDIRIFPLANGKIGIFTRPQGEIGGRGTIGYCVVSSLDEMNPDTISDAVLLDDMFVPGEWGGANEVHLLDDGKVGVLAHIARRDENEVLQYCAATFLFDTVTRDYSALGIIAKRSMFAPGPAKRPDLEDVVFSSGLIDGPEGKKILYAGVSDTEVHCVEIPNPFA